MGARRGVCVRGSWVLDAVKGCVVLGYRALMGVEVGSVERWKQGRAAARTERNREAKRNREPNGNRTAPPRLVAGLLCNVPS